MVEIEHLPIKKIIIFEVIPFDTPENLAITLVPLQLSGQPITLSWANGIVFYATQLPPTNKVIKDYTKGIIYWSNAHYSLMPDYKPKIKVEFKEGGISEIPVLDASASLNLVEVTNWLKKFKK